jgi:tetratricopeptide (TPR) repeat protein
MLFKRILYRRQARLCEVLLFRFAIALSDDCPPFPTHRSFPLTVSFHEARFIVTAYDKLTRDDGRSRPFFRYRPGTAAAVAMAAIALAVNVSIGLASEDPLQRVPGSMPPERELLEDNIPGQRLGLSGGTFDQRQQAMWELWRDRMGNREAVIRAVRDPDPEVSSRANWIIDRWRRGILPDTPADMVRQLEGISHSDSLQRLLDAGLFDGARVVIEEAVQAEDQATLTRAVAVVQRGFPFYVRSADALGRLTEFADLIDRMASTVEMIICRNQLGDVLGLEPASEKSNERKRNGEAVDRQRITVTALAAANRLDEAIEFARQADDPELLRVCQLLRGDWADLAQTQLAAAKQVPARSSESDRHWTYILVAASRGGDRALRAEAIKNLSYRPNDQQDVAIDDPFVRLRWQVLAMHGEIDAAVDILKPTQPIVAAELLAQAGRLSDAMDVLGFAALDVDSQILPLITAARAAGETWSATQLREIPEPLERLITIARLLFLAGRRDASWELFAGVAVAPTGADNANLALSRALVLQALGRLNRSDWLARMIIQDGGGSLSGADRHFLSRAMDVQPETIDSLTLGLARILPLSGAALSQAVIDFLGGDVPQDFDQHKDYQRLFDLLIGQSSGDEIRLNVRRSTNPIMPKLSLELAKLFEQHGQIDLAKKALVRLAGEGEIEAILEFAEAELKEGRAHSAKMLFESVWKRIDLERRDPGRLNRAQDDALTAMRAVLGEAVATGRLGDQEGADHLWRLIDLMACSPSAQLRNLFGSHLLDQGYNQQAERIFRLLVPWVAFGSDEGVEFYAVARNFNRAIDDSHPELAADVFDLAIAGTIESTVFYPAAYVSLPSYVQRKKVLAAASRGDIDAVRRSIDAVMQLNAIDIDFGEKAVEKLRQLGMTELADETIERIYQNGSEHLERFPLDIVTSNNLAWILALSDHRLEDALRFSRQAVYFAPDSTVYRDTLAEVLFRLDRVDEAIAIAKACLIDEPGEWHVHEQLRRFQAAQQN